MKNFRKWALLVLLPLILAACGTSVPLDERSVSDAKGVPVQSDKGADTSAMAVKQVTVADDAAAAQGPQNLTKVIYFDFDSDAIRPEFESILAGHAKYLSQYKKVHVFLEGHTDERGGREYNLALGQKRSEAVRRALGLLGATETQMEAVSFGKEKPADPGTSEDSMAKNRRVEISYR